MTALVAYFEKPNKRRSEAVDKLEAEADEIRRILIDELNHTFVTPFDREDIHALSRAIDDMLDYAYTTVVEMSILEVEPNDHMREIGACCWPRPPARCIWACSAWQTMPAWLRSHAVRVKQLENQVEQIYRQALADLFNQPRDAGLHRPDAQAARDLPPPEQRRRPWRRSRQYPIGYCGEDGLTNFSYRPNTAIKIKPKVMSSAPVMRTFTP